ncbi:hypothetical protein R6Q59_026935 [Mikania micrantha]
MFLSGRLDFGVSLKDLSAAALPYEEILHTHFCTGRVACWEIYMLHLHLDHNLMQIIWLLLLKLLPQFVLLTYLIRVYSIFIVFLGYYDVWSYPAATRGS